MQTMNNTEPASRNLALFDRYAIAVATVMGTLVAGAVLMWLNYRSMGRPDLANRTLQIAVAVQVLLVAFTAMLIPADSMLQLVPLLLQTALAFFAADQLQGPALRWHLERGATLQSVWRAAGIGFLVGLVIVFLLILVMAVLAALGFIELPAAPPMNVPAESSGAA
jgi:uncharacterized membrane protein YidH (DUF202 family)